MKLKDLAVAVGILSCFLVIDIDKEVVKGAITALVAGVYIGRRWAR